MKKTFLFTSISAIFLLSACNTPAPVTQPTDTKVTVGGITVQGPVDPNITKSNGPTTPDQSSSTPTLTNKKGIIITEKGFAPTEITATVGQELLVYNATEAQVDLYTASDDDQECTQLGSTFVLAAGETKYFKLAEPFSCFIIDQMKSDLSVKLTVE
jgi:hypothetical protein